MIKLVDIHKVYNTGSIVFEALKGINLHITKGEFTSIMGPSGSGKSTLMNILGALDTPTSGDYILNGASVSEIKKDDLAEVRNKEIGFVFQAFNLLPKLSILDNVALPLVYAGVPPKERKERAIKALERVGLGDKLKNKPTEISGGQKQRVAIARAIAGNPSVIMADEPTGNLDSKSTIEIMKIFQSLNEDDGVTIIMVTHEPDVAQYTKRIVKVQDGNIVEDTLVKDRIIL